MKSFFFIIVTYLLGFISAIPVGAVQIEVARRALKGHLRAALFVSIGAVTVDLLYGGIALFGLLPFLRDPTTMAVFWLLGGILLIYLGYLMLKEAVTYRDLTSTPARLRRRSLSFCTGASIAVANPMMILWWLLGERIIIELGLVGEFNPLIGIEFLMIGGFGMFSYPALLALTLYWIKRFISQRVLMKITFISGILVILFSLYLIMKSLITLL